MAESWVDKLHALRAEWEGGSFPALIRAFGWCAGNGHKFPDWLRQAVMDELQFSMANRPRGGTKHSTAAARARADNVHQVRFLLVEQFMQWQRSELDAGRRSALSEIEAARDAQAYLAAQKHPAGAATAEAVRRSWRKLKPV